jgi:hypothetical protein
VRRRCQTMSGLVVSLLDIAVFLSLPSCYQLK